MNLSVEYKLEADDYNPSCACCLRAKVVALERKIADYEQMFKEAALAQEHSGDEMVVLVPENTRLAQEILGRQSYE